MPGTDDRWRSQIDACRKKRDTLVRDIWQTNVSFRIQKPFSEGSADEAEDTSTDQIAVPADWSRTRSKSAALFSLIPRVSLEPTHSRYMAAAPQFEKIVNHYVTRSGAMAVMEECCADVVNAAGVCAAMAKYEATFEEVQVPAIDLSGYPMEAVQALMASGQIPMQTVTRPVSERYRWYRISPAQLLWPVSFKGADWQRAEWLGYDGSMPWAQAVREFKLTDEDKHDCCTTAGADVTNVTLAGTTTQDTDEEIVKFSELFYWAALVDPNEKRFEAIRRCVYVSGKDAAVIDEPYAGQQWNAEAGEFVGCTRLPIEVKTLTYVSDRAIPPSDSEIGRPMVLEQIRSRSQMIMQRTRNLPLRTFDVNRLDPLIADNLMRGTWQGLIPTNGPGDRVISQVAAAAFPREDFTFDQVSNRDLDDAWSMSPNQMGAYTGGERSASEANIIAGAFASVIGAQRAKIVDLFLGLVETTMGLLQLTLDNPEIEPIIGPDGVKKLESWDRSKIAGKFVATVRQDASVLQDTQARVRQLMTFLNIAGKSGRIQIDPIIAELAALSGLDPTTVMLPPAAPKPEPLNISYRLGGVEDLHDPISMAILIKAGQAPGPQEMSAAKKLLQDAQTPLPPPMPPPGMPGMPGAPGLPPGPPPQGLLLPGPPGPPPPSEPDPGWGSMERVQKRPVEELGG